MKYLLVIVLLWSAVALGQYKTSCTDTIEITTLPYTMGSSDTCYCLLSGTTSSSADNGINFNGKDRILLTTKDGAASTLSFAVGGADAKYGFLMDGVTYATIKGINITAGGGVLSDDNDSGNACIKITGSTNNCLFYDLGFYPDGLDGRGVNQIVDAGYNSYNLRFSNCVGYQWSNKFTRRDYYMASIMKFEFSKIAEYPDYHLQIDSCDFERSIHVAVAVTGSQVPQDSGALVYMFDNEFHQDGRNDLYTTYTDNSAQSLGDNFALSFIGLRRRSEIYRNTIYGDSTAAGYGGMGMLIQGAHGWPNLPVKFYENDMVLRSGDHIALSRLKQATQGFYLRALDGFNGNQNLWVYNNNIQIYVDTSQATTSIGEIAEGIRVLVTDVDHDIIIANNHVSVNRNDSALGTGSGVTGSEVIATGLTVAQATDLGDRLRVFGNYFGAPIPLRYGSNREADLGANATFLNADTFAAYADIDTTIWFETVGSYLGHSIGNIHQDCIWAGYADPTKVVFSGGSSVDSLGKSVEWWQTVKLLCLGSNGQPIAAAPIYYGNAYHEGLLGYSDLQGWLNAAVKVRYDHQDYIVGDGYNPGDSVFNPFDFTGYTPDGLDSAATSMTITQTVFVDTLVFATTGSAPASGEYRMVRKKIFPGTEVDIIGPPVQ